MIHVRFNGGEVYSFEPGISVLDALRSADRELFKTACVCRIGGEVFDLRETLTADTDAEILGFGSEEGRRAFRHTASHILAHAVKR